MSFSVGEIRIAIHSKWSFEVSSYVGSKFEKKRKDFVKLPEKPKTAVF